MKTEAPEEGRCALSGLLPRLKKVLLHSPRSDQPELKSQTHVQRYSIVNLFYQHHMS